MNKLTMSVKEMAGQLGISLPKAYELTHIKGFPVIHVGRRKIVPVERFAEWLDENLGNRITGRGDKGSGGRR
jgi:excisionase family DNA binding protein